MSKILSVNPYLSEYVYDLLWNITDEDRRKLPRKYWRLLSSSTRARNFADFSTLEEKMQLFSALNMEYGIVFCQNKFNNVAVLKQILSKYQADRSAGAVKDITGLKIFVSADKEMSFLLSLISQTIHHKSYFINQQYNKVGFSVKEWDKTKTTIEGAEFKDAIENCDIIDKTLLNCMVNADNAPDLLGLTSFDVKTLLYLNQFRHSYIEREAVADYFSLYNKKKI